MRRAVPAVLLIFAACSSSPNPGEALPGRSETAAMRDAGGGVLRIVGKGDVADICRLTCLEHGVNVVSDKDAPVLQVEGFKVLLRMEDKHE